MLYQNRDFGISRIKARKCQRCYGMGLGVMILDIPVFMSSLLQVPLMRITSGGDHKVGLLCALKNLLTETHLKSFGIEADDNIVIAGAMDEYHLPEFDSLWITLIPWLSIGSITVTFSAT